MNFMELMKKTRSYRSFDRSVRLSGENLTELIAHARLAPSSMNAQMLKYHPVTDEAECSAVLSLTRWAGKLKELKLPPVGHEPVAYIIICADRTVLPNADSFDTDVGIAAEVLMLAAAERGWGGCIIGSFDRSGLSALLPSHVVPKLVLSLGKPDEEVCLTDAALNGSVTYYRRDGIHYVQKRSVEDLIL